MESKKITRKRRSTFAVTFFVNGSKPKKNGYLPLRGRITVDAGFAQFSCQTDVNPARWDAKAGRATGTNRESVAVNRIIDRFTEDIKGYYAECLDRNGYVTAELIKNRLKGIGSHPETLLALFREHNAEYEKRVGIDRKKEALQCYVRSCRRVEEFIAKKYNREDMPLKMLDQQFIEEYHLFMKIDKRLADKTILEHITYLRKITCRATNQGTLMVDPYATYRVEQKPSPFRHLQAEEMERVMQVEIDDEKVRFTRDLFVFSCMSGLAFIDLCTLADNHLRSEPDGSRWIRIKRGKTGVECNIRLLKLALIIMDKYKGERINGKIFNLKYNYRQTIPSHMRVLEKLCGIPHITFHMARHNFATHITLSQGVPLTTVSRMMGHTSVKTTQIYAKMMDHKVNEDVRVLSEKIKGKYHILDEPTEVKPAKNAQ